MSDLALANVDALANDESGSGDPCYKVGMIVVYLKQLKVLTHVLQKDVEELQINVINFCIEDV